MALPRVRVFVKRKLALERLTLGQRTMYELGKFGLAELKQRVQQARNAEDAPAKKLWKGYAIWKTRQGKGNRRNLTLSGKMLDNLQVRTVSENAAYARPSSEKERKKAQGNEKREQWAAFSPRNQREIVTRAMTLLKMPKLQA
jgi:hypothetical protein